MVNPIALHSTPIKNSRGIEKRGLRKQPFWRTNIPWGRLRTLSLFSSPKSFILSGTTREEKRRMVYDSLHRASKHLTKNQNPKFDLRRISIFLVDVNASKQGKTKIHLLSLPEESSVLLPAEERVLYAPPCALRKIQLSENEIISLEKKTREMDVDKTNLAIVDYLVKKIEAKTQ